ncbi:MAG: DJ-1/PfpI family protein [Bacillales bacterium]
MKILTIINDYFEDIECFLTLDLLNRVGINYDLITLQENIPVTSASKIVVNNVTKFTNIDVNNYDAIFIPGGAHYISLINDSRLINLVNLFINNDKYVFAICAAPTILGHKNLLVNKNYTCYPEMNEDFKGNFTYSKACIDNKLITGQAPGASFEFAFLIIETLKGKEILNQLKLSIHY